MNLLNPPITKVMIGVSLSKHPGQMTEKTRWFSRSAIEAAVSSKVTLSTKGPATWTEVVTGTASDYSVSHCDNQMMIAN